MFDLTVLGSRLIIELGFCIVKLLGELNDFAVFSRVDLLRLLYPLALPLDLAVLETNLLLMLLKLLLQIFDCAPKLKVLLSLSLELLLELSDLVVDLNRGSIPLLARGAIFILGGVCISCVCILDRVCCLYSVGFWVDWVHPWHISKLDLKLVIHLLHLHLGCSSTYIGLDLLVVRRWGDLLRWPRIIDLLRRCDVQVVSRLSSILLISIAISIIIIVVVFCILLVLIRVVLGGNIIYLFFLLFCHRLRQLGCGYLGGLGGLSGL